MPVRLKMPAGCLAVLLTAVLSGGCRPGGRNSAESAGKVRRPNIFIYLVDTLRRDHLGLYGYERNTSPRLNEFAKDAVVFEEAYSPSGWTKPAVASLLTGLNPRKHGAITRDNALPQDVKMLGEYLSPLGYHTTAVVTNANIIPYWGFDQGFGAFLDVRQETRNRHPDADVVNEWVFKHLADNTDWPIFCYIHTLDPHSPYDPKPPYDRMFTDDDLGLSSPAGLSPDTPTGVVRSTVARYDGEIAFNDAQFGLLMDHLKEKGLYDDALIIMLSDHGEEFLDHAEAGHGHTLYQELVHVPLMVKWPGNARAGTRVQTRVALIDWVPTILDYLGQEVPAELEGVPMSFLYKEAGAADRSLFFDLDLVRANGQVLNVSKGLLSGPYKYIEVDRPEKRRMLFDLGKDPDENNNLYSSQGEMADTLSELLRAYQADAAAGMHLRVVNDSDEQDRIVVGTLKTEGRFTRLRKLQLEENDQAEIGDGGRTITFRFPLANYPHPTGGKPKWLVDSDHLAFQIEPPDALVIIERLKSSNGEQFPIYMGAEKRRVDSLPIQCRQSDAGLRVPDIGALFRTADRGYPRIPMGAYLATVAPVARVDIDLKAMPSDLRRSLKALGYIGGDNEDEEDKSKRD